MSRLRLSLLCLTLFAGWAVDAQAAPRFTDNGDGSATDTVTGFIWQRQDDGATRTWRQALDYCESMVAGGSDAWRLPNVKELHTLVDPSFSTPAIDPAVFPSTKATGYWTSTSRAGSPNFAWYVYFSKGQVSTDMKTNPNYVRCVR